MYQTFNVKINGKTTRLSRTYVKNLLLNSGQADDKIIADMKTLDEGKLLSLKVAGVSYEVEAVSND